MFQNEDDRKVHTGYYLPKVEIKDSNVIIDGKNFFDERYKSDIRRYHNIQKIARGQGDDYTTVLLMDYNDFKKRYKLIAIDLSKQQVLDADPKAVQQINFTGILDRDNGATMFFINAEPKEIVSDFSQGTVKIL